MLKKVKTNKFKSLVIFILQIGFNFSFLAGLTIKADSHPIKLSNNTTKVQNKRLSKVGRFTLTYSTTSKFPNTVREIKRSGYMEASIKELNKKNLNLPVNIPVNLKECGKPNAHYNLRTHEIVLCYDLIVYIHNFFIQKGIAPDDAMLLAIGSGVMTLFHEAGHALVDTLDLAITGKEEDTVDDFAATLILDDNNIFPDEILVVMGNFFNEFQADIPFWAEHSTGEQRSFNWVCMLFGKNPQKYAKYAVQSGLGESRAAKSPRETLTFDTLKTDL